jgi:hypothetical protein
MKPKLMGPGDFKWFDVGQPAEGEFQSSSDKEVRLIDIIFSVVP